jgi:hypothetical protein
VPTSAAMARGNPPALSLLVAAAVDVAATGDGVGKALGSGDTQEEAATASSKAVRVRITPIVRRTA